MNSYFRREMKSILGLLLQLSQDLFRIFGPGETIHDLQFCKLHIYWIVVFAEEHLHIILQDCRSPLDDQEYVP